MRKKLFDPAFIIATTFFLLCVAVIEILVLKSTNGVFMYPLDDTFIHMVVAKNLAYHGTWGINEYEFGSASSSLLYTLILAVIFKIFSVNTLVPFIVNVITSLVLLFVGNEWLKKQDINTKGRVLILSALIFIIPLPSMAIAGMEHTLQCLFTFMFITGFSEWLDDTQSNSLLKDKKFPVRLFVIGMLVVSIRYEGLFLIGISGLILFYYRKFFTAIKLGLISVLPVIVFGLYSVLKGSYFFPNSVLLKSEKIEFSATGLIHFFKVLFLDKLTIIGSITGEPSPKPGISLLATQLLMVLLPVLFLIFNKSIRQKSAYVYSIILLCGTILIHLSFASTGWFYRYEAYLIMSSFFILAAILYKYGKPLYHEKIWGMRLVCIVLASVLFAPFFYRSVVAHVKAPLSCINIYDQQYQMARFSKDYYNKEVIAMNDIGAVSFMTEGRNLDLWGLGSIDIARSKKEGYNSPQFVDSLCRASNVSVAMIYDSWFTADLVDKWKKVATWQIQNNVICGDDIVSFYVVNTDKEDELRKNLKEFESRLPKTVAVRYY